ncbi:MAG: zinc-dependent alcohol dehydrogenase family protein [Rhodoplanes sp.]|jgi:NADPH:quinone reductase-like Zn-dependent oxidoreductase
MVKVVRFHETGGAEVLRVEDLPPSKPGSGEVRLRVAAIGLNRAEALFRSGQYLEAPRLPARIGYEAAGVVDAVGDGVAAFQPGEAVSVIPAFSMNEYGVYGEQAVVPARAVVKTPPGVSAVEAAALWMQYLTAYGALIDIGGLTAGDFVIIPAASSSVGLAAIQIARLVGATAIATTRTRAKKPALLDAGAPHVIATQEEDLAAAVMRLTGGRGARLVFDPVAGPYVETLANATAKGGTIFLYGVLSLQPTPFPLVKALANGLTLRGYTLFEITLDPARLARGIAFVNRGLAEGALRPIIARTFPLDAIVEAHRYLESNAQIGKIVVTVEKAAASTPRSSAGK